MSYGLFQGNIQTIPADEKGRDFMKVQNDTKTWWVLGHRITPIETIGDYGMIAVVSLPGVPGPPPHYHEDASEMFYISQGKLDVMAPAAVLILQGLSD